MPVTVLVSSGSWVHGSPWLCMVADHLVSQKGNTAPPVTMEKQPRYARSSSSRSLSISEAILCFFMAGVFIFGAVCSVWFAFYVKHAGRVYDLVGNGITVYATGYPDP